MSTHWLYPNEACVRSYLWHTLRANLNTAKSMPVNPQCNLLVSLSATCFIRNRKSRTDLLSSLHADNPLQFWMGLESIYPDLTGSQKILCQPVLIQLTAIETEMVK